MEVSWRDIDESKRRLVDNRFEESKWIVVASTFSVDLTCVDIEDDMRCLENKPVIESVKFVLSVFFGAELN